MWEIQPEWPHLDVFFIVAGGKRIHLKRTTEGLVCADTAVAIQNRGRSGNVTVPEQGACSFIGPKQVLGIHEGSSVNCVAVSPDGREVLSGDSEGRLFLTHVGTEPVPMPGPTPGFGVEDCAFDPMHGLFFACGGDFRIYEYSATEYAQTGRYDGHASCVTRVRIIGDSVVSSSRDGALGFWDLATRKRTSSSVIGSPVNDLCASDCGALFVACDAGVRAVDARSGRGAPGPDYRERCNCVAAHGDEVAVGTEGGSIGTWDVRSTAEATGEWAWYDAPVNRVQYNEGRLWCATNDGTGACVSVREKRAHAILGTRAYAPLRGIAFSKGIEAWTADGEGRLTHFEL